MINSLVLFIAITTAAPFNVEIFEVPSMRLCQDAELVRRVVDTSHQFQYACEPVTEEPLIDPRLAAFVD